MPVSRRLIRFDSPGEAVSTTSPPRTATTDPRGTSAAETTSTQAKTTRCPPARRTRDAALPFEGGAGRIVPPWVDRAEPTLLRRPPKSTRHRRPEQRRTLDSHVARRRPLPLRPARPHLVEHLGGDQDRTRGRAGAARRGHPLRRRGGAPAGV